MSRSFKHVPGFCDRSKDGKKFANRKIRNTEDVPNGRAFRKFYDPYNICDWKALFFSLEEIKECYGDKIWKTFVK